MPASLYLCLHLRDFAAQAIACSQSALHKQPLAILSGEPVEPVDKGSHAGHQSRYSRTKLNLSHLGVLATLRGSATTSYRQTNDR